MTFAHEASTVPSSPDGVRTEATNGKATPENRFLSPIDSLASDSGLILNSNSGLFEDGVTRFDLPGEADVALSSTVKLDPVVPESGSFELDARTRDSEDFELVGTPIVLPAVDVVQEPVSSPSVHRQIIVDESMPPWYRVNVAVQQFPPTDVVEEVAGRLQINKEALQKAGVKVTQCEETLLSQPELLKLSDVSQMGIRFSEHGRWMTHSRLDHSLDVMEAGGRIASRLGLSRYEVQLARLGGLLHDVGHIAFAHTGERIYRSITGDISYDHDDMSVEKLAHGDLHSIIQHFNRADGSLLPEGASVEEGIDPKHLIAILDDTPPLSDSQIRSLQSRDDLSAAEGEQLAYALLQKRFSHIRFIVKEVADRAYLRTDVMGTAFSAQVRDSFFAIYDSFEQSVRIDPVASTDEFGARGVFFEDLAPARRLLAARDALYHEYSCNIRTMLASQWLTRAVEDAIVFGDLTTELLQDLGETPILRDHLRGRYRDWFHTSQNAVGGCIESYIEPVVAYQRGALTAEGVEYVFNSAEGSPNHSLFMRDLRDAVLKQFPEIGNNINDLMFTATENYSKNMSLTYSKSGQIVPGTLSRELPDDSRYFMVSIPSDGSAGVSVDQIAQIEIIALELLNQSRFIKSGYAPMTKTIYQPHDPSLYIDQRELREELLN